MKLQEWGPHDAISAPIRRGRENSTVWLPRADTVRRQRPEPRRETPPGTESAGTLTLDPSLQNREKSMLLLKPQTLLFCYSNQDG